MDEKEAVLLPWQPASVSAEMRQRLDEGYPQFGAGGLAPFGSQRFLVTSDAEDWLKEYRNTIVYPDDTWVMSLPKCGTTWMQEMVWLLNHDCDFRTSQCLLSPDRYHFLELAVITTKSDREAIAVGNNPISKRQLESVSGRSRPRHIKTHLPLTLCPSNLLDVAKVIYVARNPKDMCVSYFNHLRLFGERNLDMSLDHFADLFVKGEVMELPFFSHVLEAWKNRHRKNFLFIFFEEMKTDLRSCILRVAEFLGKSLSENQLKSLEDHLSFESMKKNKWTNKSMLSAYLPYIPDNEICCVNEETEEPKDVGNNQFMRKGKVGEWKKHLSDSTSLKFDQWIEKELDGTDLQFRMS